MAAMVLGSACTTRTGLAHILGVLFFLIQCSEGVPVDVEWIPVEGCKKWKDGVPEDVAYASNDIDISMMMAQMGISNCVSALDPFQECSKEYIGVAKDGRCWCVHHGACNKNKISKKPYKFLFRAKMSTYFCT